MSPAGSTIVVSAPSAETQYDHNQIEIIEVWRPWVNTRTGRVLITIPRRYFVYNLQPEYQPHLESRSFDQRTTSATTVSVPEASTSTALSSLSSFVASFGQPQLQPVAGPSWQSQSSVASEAFPLPQDRDDARSFIESNPRLSALLSSNQERMEKICLICNRLFQDQPALDNHMNTEHAE